MNPDEMASRISRIETAWCLVREAHEASEQGVARAQEILLGATPGPSIATCWAFCATRTPPTKS